mmetsp:Transcript_19232/g.27391  ORF Transcript_19232/g.27391 Transcript_19232/m.27391 type:complete len:389 (-) Transcript_19232:2559-3725(-)
MVYYLILLYRVSRVNENKRSEMSFSKQVLLVAICIVMSFAFSNATILPHPLKERNLSGCSCSFDINCSYQYGQGEGNSFSPKKTYAACYKKCCSSPTDDDGPNDGPNPNLSVQDTTAAPPSTNTTSKPPIPVLQPSTGSPTCYSPTCHSSTGTTSSSDIHPKPKPKPHPKSKPKAKPKPKSKPKPKAYGASVAGYNTEYSTSPTFAPTEISIFAKSDTKNPTCSCTDYGTSTCKKCIAGDKSCPDSQCAKKCCQESNYSCDCSKYGKRMCNICSTDNTSCVDKQCASKCCTSYPYTAEGNSWTSRSSQARSYGYQAHSGVLYSLLAGVMLVAAGIAAIAYRRRQSQTKQRALPVSRRNSDCSSEADYVRSDDLSVTPVRKGRYASRVV